MVEANAALRSSIPYDKDHQFPLENIPFGVFVNPVSKKVHCCTRIGDKVIDLAVHEARNMFKSGPLMSKLDHTVFDKDTLNAFIELGPDYRREVRKTLQEWYHADTMRMMEFVEDLEHNPADCQMRMPVFIRDYTDFYSSKNHAFNVGCMFRGPDNALNPNWLHLPVGYHGRASSIVVSGTPIRRPKGQVSADKLTPSWSQCNRLDLELEMGTIIGKNNALGDPIKVSEAKDHIFGYVLLNDWSARDLQVWEYVPLGPFNAKNFASTIGAWVITPEALEPFKVALPKQEPELLPYL